MEGPRATGRKNVGKLRRGDLGGQQGKRIDVPPGISRQHKKRRDDAHSIVHKKNMIKSWWSALIIKLLWLRVGGWPLTRSLEGLFLFLDVCVPLS